MHWATALSSEKDGSSAGVGVVRQGNAGGGEGFFQGGG